ncbi:hypothetical protein QAD02_020220 [Eretmocerus hayati]|uniref:Uncharacterized protein n=1 Tax=Eretmocerus hayati TaxID=131215 RepID=A0ACC2PLX3_9HYME|nr:hypothetical protein QAD02_020220 [Eretmocerus hayati]
MGKNKSLAKKRKLNLKKDNLVEDRVIKSLEKKLHFKKKSRTCLPKSFVADGLDYLLELCDDDTRGIAAEKERKLILQSDDEGCINRGRGNHPKSHPSTNKRSSERKKEAKSSEEQSDSSNDSYLDSEDLDSFCNGNILKRNNRDQKIAKIKCNASKNVKKPHAQIECEKYCMKKPAQDDIESPAMEGKCDLSDDGSDLFSDYSEAESQEPSKSNTEDCWEDIYGRKRDKDGNIVIEKQQKYVAPARRLNTELDPKKNEKLNSLRRQIKGLLNRLAESNMHSITSQLEELFMSNSRNDMNELLSQLMMESIILPVLTAERLVMEHMMCIAILHANIDTQVGAHFIMILAEKFDKLIQTSPHVENKEIDNLVLMICHLYNFKIFGSQLIYDILNKLVQDFSEKEIELILVVLKAAGFRLRKDDPLALKGLILNLQERAAKTQSSNSRVQFMLQILLAIKNNNMNKIPQYDQSHMDHLQKILKNLIRKGNTISQLNLTLEDLLHADAQGKWWIIGSAWSGKLAPGTGANKSPDQKPAHSQKLLDLARSQRMNTDVRKNIFCILMTAEDYLDAFEKLHHLGLKDRQEREIIYVILNCCLQEKKFNPYYAVLLQKFCEYDRKYQMTLQYTIWDKIKILDSFKSRQIVNLAKLMSHLFIHKGLPLSVLKVIELGELSDASMRFFKAVMLEILLHKDEDTSIQVFERITSSPKLHQFREGLRLFINYFLLKNIEKDCQIQKTMGLLKLRIERVDKLLINSASRCPF